MNAITDDRTEYTELHEFFEAMFPPTATLGSQCRDIRRTLDITQRELAEHAKVAFKDVSDLENDRSRAGEDSRCRVLVALVAMLWRDNVALRGAK